MFTVQVSCFLLVDAEVRVLLNFPIPVLLADFKGPVMAVDRQLLSQCRV